MSGKGSGSGNGNGNGKRGTKRRRGRNYNEENDGYAGNSNNNNNGNGNGNGNGAASARARPGAAAASASAAALVARRNGANGNGANGGESFSTKARRYSGTAFGALRSGAAAAASGASNVYGALRSSLAEAAEARRSRDAEEAQRRNVARGANKLSYKSPYPQGIARSGLPAARANVSSGQLMTTWLERTMNALVLYQQEYARADRTLTPAATNVALEGYAERVFGAYIRFYLAQIKHGKAKPAGPRYVGEESNVEEEVTVPGMFGFGTATARISVAKAKVVRIAQDVNVIVQAHPALAAQYGLTERGANEGPTVDVAVARAKIAGDSNAADFAGGRRRKTRKGRKQRTTRKSKGRRRM
jgi:hypothetical protein